MVKRRLKAVLALVVAMMFVLQTVPMYTFAEQASGDTLVASEQADSQTADKQNESELNYMIDENGNQVDLTDEMREEIYSGDSSEDLGLYKADVDSFFEYDEEEVQVASDTYLNESFDGYNVGATEVPGWVLKSVSKGGNPINSTISVEESTRGNALKMTKNKNGAKNEAAEAGDESLYAVYDLGTPVQSSTAVVTADMYVEQAGRLGMFVYGPCDDISAAIDNSVNDSSNNVSIPYIARGFLWDTGATGADPLSAGPEGIRVWDNNSRIDSDANKSTSWSLNQWYNLRLNINTDAGTYDFVMTNQSGTAIANVRNQKLTAGITGIQGIGFNISNDTKSLGSIYVKNIKVINNNTSQEDIDNVAADRTALSLPVDFDANNVTSSFTVDTAGKGGSTITWTSSNKDVVSVDINGNATVTRPEFSGAAYVDVVLTATLEKGLASATRTFNLRVLEQDPGTAADKVAADKELLDLPETLNPSSVTEGFTMPVAGRYGSVYTYASSNNSIVSVDNTTGAVTVNKAPFTGSAAQEVTLTATIKNGSAQDTKAFTLNIAEEEPKTDAEKALYDVNNALISGIDITNIRQDSFYLTDKGKYGSLSWFSSDDNYINISDNYYEEDGSDSDSETDGEGNSDPSTVVNQGGYKAVVTRPARNSNDITVTLTVTANVNGTTATKEFTAIVRASDALKAFPGVEGYGAYSVGGRGGQVYHVTNLNAEGVGSLKYGLEEIQGPRTIVFDVGGVIDLTDYGQTLNIKGEKYANVTVAGQTAPYPGITLKGWGLSIGSTHDVIVRNIKIRIGDTFETNARNQSDPLSIGNSKRVVVDHCTMQWAVDMEFRTTGEYITLSNNAFGKGMTANSPHEKGGHSYSGMINEGDARTTFAKNYLTDSTQRTPRICDAEWVDAYNNLLYNCGNGFDIHNYEWQDKNAKMNVYKNFARKGPTISNSTPYRSGRGRAYSGGVMVYFDDNYGRGESTDKQEKAVNDKSTFAKVLDFGKTNGTAGNKYDLSNVTLDEWNSNPDSYDNLGKSSSAATITYMDYAFPAPRGNALDVFTGNTNNIINSVLGGKGNGAGAGATRPGRDLYDTMMMKEMQGGTQKTAKMTAEEVEPFFKEITKRTGIDYTNYRALVRDYDPSNPIGYKYSEPQNYITSRSWTVKDFVGPTLKGAGTGSTETKPVHWDDYTDVNKNTNPDASKKYESYSVMDFEIGDWWGEYCGSPGQQLVYELINKDTGATVTTNNSDYDQTKYDYLKAYKAYVAVERTVSDLFPTKWMEERDKRHAGEEGYKSVVDFMNNYREKHYPYTSAYDNYDEYRAARANGTLDTFDYDVAYTSRKISWDGMGDGIPNWYKEYRGWSRLKYLADEVNPETGYTYLEEYLQFMADDEPSKTEDDPAVVENFKTNNIGYSTAQVFWNTTYRATCVIEYGTEPGNYTNSEVLLYNSDTDYYHTYHAITLRNLKPSTQYYYRITSVDENSTTYVAEYDPNNSEESKMTFTTTAATGDTNIHPSKPTVDNVVPYLNQVRLNWTGDVTTDDGYSIYYDTSDHGGDYTSFAHKLTGIDARINKQTVTGLENNTLYYFVLVAENANGKTASDIVTATPSGVLIDYDFDKMTPAERDKFMKTEFMYVLGGAVTIQRDPDTGQYVLQMLDETNSHGVNMNVKMPTTQQDKLTFEVKMKILYQKQTDAINGMVYNKSGKNIMTTTGSNEHNTLQLNFSKDAMMNEDMDSTSSIMWDSAFSIFFDSESELAADGHTTMVTGTDSEGNKSTTTRYDGLDEQNLSVMKFQSTRIGKYNIGKTVGSAYNPKTPIQPSTLKAPANDGDRVLPFNPYGLGYENGTGYGIASYAYTTPYGDAVFSHGDDTGKTLHALWYYQKGSAKFITYKVVIDCLANSIKIYADGEPVYEQGTFNENLEEPYNIGKIEIKSRNDGYSWLNVASIKVTNGDGTSSEGGNTTKPVSPGTVASTGGGGGGATTPAHPTAAPQVTEDPNVTPNPDATQAPATDPVDPETNKYFDDLGSVAWAVESINKLAENGIITGTGDRQFSPASNVTRSEFVTMLMRAYGSDVTAAAVQFNDAAEGEWYYEPIAKAVALGVVNGYDNGSFGINDNISREDMMVMAYRTMNAIGVTVPKNKDYQLFNDQSSINDYAAEAVEAMYCADIINGVGDNMLDPKGEANRAQSAKIIYGLTNMEGTVNE